MTDNFLRSIDWDTFNFATITQETVERIAEQTDKFFMTRTKAELLEGAVKHRIMLYPVSTTKDIVESIQLAAREYWVEVEHPELGTTITYPGAFVKASETPPRISRRAPLIGEHNQEIYQKELALSKKELMALKQAKGYPAKLNEKSQRENLAKKPLAGLRVADFGWYIVGPQTSRILADYGSEVIKIEGRSRPDAWRLMIGKDNIPVPIIPKAKRKKAKLPARGFKASAASVAVEILLIPSGHKVAAAVKIIKKATILEKNIPIIVSKRIIFKSLVVILGRFSLVIFNLWCKISSSTSSSACQKNK